MAFDEDDKEAIIAELEREDRIAFAAVIARMKSIAARAKPIDGLSDVVVAPVPQTALDEIATALLVQTMSEKPDAPPHCRAKHQGRAPHFSRRIGEGC